jgi:D-alanyl-D-alanine carboxypeptidase
MLRSRSLLHRTAEALSWWVAASAPDEAMPLPQTIETLAEAAVVGGYSAGIGVGFCLPIKTPAITCFGRANIEANADLTGESLFRVGACTRQFTAAAILLLAEQGKLRLDDSVASFFVEAAHSAEDVTVRQLLAGDENSYALLGRLIERVTGEGYADFVTEALLIPAGMASSRFDDPTRIIPHRAAGYRLGGGRVHQFRNVLPGKIMAAADGLYATAGDLLLWNRALYSGRILSRDSVQLMTTGSPTDPSCPVLGSLLSRAGRGWGVEVGRLFGHRAFWQRGRMLGFDSWLFHFPDDRIDLSLLANTEEGAATILEPMLCAILRV